MPSALGLSKKYLRPAMIIFCESEPVLGELGWDLTGGIEGSSFLYITDDGRDPVSVGIERIENRQRMANGRMRTYHVVDKKTFSTGWTDLPSRSTDESRDYISELQRTELTNFAAGQEIKSWYESIVGDFWVLMVYDASALEDSVSQVEKYNVFFESFDFSVTKRGQHNDLWDVNISLVEA